MQTNEVKCIGWCLMHEGGYTNNPHDPGGPTNWGITIFDARKYWNPHATAADVKAMPRAVAIEIYNKRYWDAQRLDDIPSGPDYTTFDYGVNSGIGRSSRVLQRIVGVKDDGKIGPVTLRAVQAVNPSAIVNAMCDERMRFLRALSTWPVFGKGWTTRVNDVRRVALDLAAGKEAKRERTHRTHGKGWVRAPLLLNKRGVPFHHYDWEHWEAEQAYPTPGLQPLR